MQVFPVLGVDWISPEFRLRRQVGVSHTSRRTIDTEDAVHHTGWMISSHDERSSHVSKLRILRWDAEQLMQVLCESGSDPVVVQQAEDGLGCLAVLDGDWKEG